MSLFQWPDWAVGQIHHFFWAGDAVPAILFSTSSCSGIPSPISMVRGQQSFSIWGCSCREGLKGNDVLWSNLKRLWGWGGTQGSRRERKREAGEHAQGVGGNCHKRIGRNQLSDRLLSLDTVSPAVSGHSVVAIFLFSNGLLWFCGENDNSLFCFIFSESICTTSFIFQFGTRTQERWSGHMRTEGRDANRIGGQCNHSREQLVERWERGRMKVVLMSCTQPRGFNLPVRPSDFSLTLSPLWGPQPGYCPRRTDVFRCTGKGCLGAKAFPSVSLLLEMDVSPLGE